MMKEQNKLINCSTFEELLSDYLDKTLGSAVNRSVAAHAISCPLCHSLLNDVKVSLEVCRTISGPATAQLTRIEARVLAMTMPEAAMPCDEFEEHLTDYLDGFLPASRFHHWERHAAICASCEDLPGMVVRSIAACYTYKMDELAIPAGLHQRIMNLTLGSESSGAPKASWTSQAGDWIRGIRWPVAVPQLASVTMMFGFAFLVFSQTVSADGSLAGVYQKSYELAEQTYHQSAEAWIGKPADATPNENRDPITGTTTVGNEENK